MNIDERIIERFNQLIKDGSKIKRPSKGIFANSDLAIQWQVSCKSFLKTVFGENSVYTNEFSKHIYFKNEKLFFSEPVSVIKAAKEDFENGYLFDTRTLIEAEVFDDFLEQAEQLFDKGYYEPSSVIAGCVLEDGLRKLCDKNSITLPAKATIDPMNIELAKVGIYNKLWQKKITALADLRNKAAHGKWDEFEKKDVEDMIRDVRRFMEDYFS